MVYHHDGVRLGEDVPGKSGLLATAAGAKLAMKLPARCEGNVGIEALHTYNNAGAFRVTALRTATPQACAGGALPPEADVTEVPGGRVVDTLWGTHASLGHLIDLDFKGLVGAECGWLVIELVEPPTPRDGMKVKLLSVSFL